LAVEYGRYVFDDSASGWRVLDLDLDGWLVLYTGSVEYGDLDGQLVQPVRAEQRFV
jgi:hypothetical protein